MLTDSFQQRVVACGGTVSTSAPADLPDVLAELLSGAASAVIAPDLASLSAALDGRGVHATVVGADFPPAGVGGSLGGTTAPGGRLEDDLRHATASVTRALAGIARSGTVVVGPGGGNGGLLASLVPLHVVILDEADIVESLAEAVAVVSGRFDELGGEAVFISGPSRTADIEMMSVIGVHGPLALHVVIVQGGEA